MRKRHSLFTCATIMSAGLLSVPALANSDGITTESINDYDGNGDLANSIANGNGFRSGMMPSGSTFWSAGDNLTDGFVFDSHFVDDDIYGNGNDYAAFDEQGDAIAYFTGHGMCNAGTSPVQSCSTSSQCNSPGPGQSLPGSCQDAPNISPNCRYWSNRHMITNGIWSWFSNDVNYSYGIKWGESAYSGSWAGAGTDGGVNLVVADISCGSVPSFESELFSIFAGLHMLATIMPIAGDTANLATRGSTFASRWAANSNGSVGQAWMDTLTLLPASPSGGSACGASGGGRGINGCGANHAFSIAPTAQEAANKIDYESWVGLKNDNNDATSQGYWAGRIICNYDCSANPIVL